MGPIVATDSNWKSPRGTLVALAHDDVEAARVAPKLVEILEHAVRDGLFSPVCNELFPIAVPVEPDGDGRASRA